MIKFVLDTKEYGLKIKPVIDKADEAWSVTMFTNSDYAGDVKTCVSVMGFCILLLGIPVSWQSKSQRSITLLLSKAKFVALSEAAKEVKFIVQIMQSIGIKVKLPVIMRVDNVGAIFMAENLTTSQHKKHEDICYHCL